MIAEEARLSGAKVNIATAIFLGILVLIWLAELAWCALSCLQEGARWIWNQRRILVRLFRQQKEDEP